MVVVAEIEKLSVHRLVNDEDACSHAAIDDHPPNR